MSAFAKLEATFHTNWTTVLVGWSGLGVLSPWQTRWAEFPPLISADEVDAYSERRIISSSDSNEQDLITEILLIDRKIDNRGLIRNKLEKLSNFDNGIPEIELRKWRVILLERLLCNMPEDAVYGPLALSEFWQEFGFPPDSPHSIQGRGNAIDPSMYYGTTSFQAMLDRHCEWLKHEKLALVD